MQLKKSKVGSYQIIIVLASIIPIFIFGFLTYNNSKKNKIETTFGHIKTSNIQKEKIIREYFKNVEFNIKELSKTISFLQEQATHNIINIQSLQKEHLQSYYSSLETDIIGLAKKDMFKYVYTLLKRSKKVDTMYLHTMDRYIKGLHLKNVLMLDSEGKILYSNEDESLLGHNIDNLNESFQNTSALFEDDTKLFKTLFFQTTYNKFTDSYKNYIL
jgi:hypothetical protein